MDFPDRPLMLRRSLQDLLFKGMGMGVCRKRPRYTPSLYKVESYCGLVLILRTFS